MPFHIGEKSGPPSARAGKRVFAGPAGPSALLAFTLASGLALLAGSAAAPAHAASKAGGKPAVGSPAPDFRLAALAKGGEATSLKSLEGQVVLLDFWASWCAPCRRTLPAIAGLGTRHKGLKVLAVSLDEDRRKAEAFLKEREKDAGASDLMDALHDSKREVAARYDLGGMPSAVLIDRKGVLRARFDGYTERDLGRMEEAARKLLEEKP